MDMIATHTRLSLRHAGEMVGRLAGLIVALTLCSVAPALAQDEEVTRIDRFQLWNDCKPLRLFVGKLDNDAAEIGLTREAITTTVRSRLRGARIYSEDGNAWLYVTVNTVNPAFSVKLQFIKLVVDGATNITWGAVTWDAGTFGTQGGNGSYVLGAVSRLMDRFIDEFLRVNGDDCS